MTMPARRIRPRSGRRSFDLRSTALFFVLLALLLCVLGFAVRTLAGTAERRPAWVAVLCLAGLAAVLAWGRRRHRLSGARTARRAAAALEEGVHTALEEWEAPAAGVPSADGLHVTDSAGYFVGSPAGDDRAYDYDYADYDYEALDADEFERAVAGLCARDGCSGVEVVGGAGDLGADVLAVAPDGRRVVIQCKRYGEGHRVGSQDLQRFGGTCYTVHEADVAVLVTTSDFTAPAAEYAEQCGIVCVDRPALRAWHDGTGLPPWLLGPDTGAGHPSSS
ncbi:restriction endonuclease [Streptomyces nogalater]|uniref:Restriction endonuclease n=1 Tax=Streptomyces nogalater TaxID=38314 RepID=A0ABW0WFD8_STRNO